VPKLHPFKITYPEVFLDQTSSIIPNILGFGARESHTMLSIGDQHHKCHLDTLDYKVTTMNKPCACFQEGDDSIRISVHSEVRRKHFMLLFDVLDNTLDLFTDNEVEDDKINRHTVLTGEMDVLPLNPFVFLS
jgi:hypothetical protein